MQTRSFCRSGRIVSRRLWTLRLVLTTQTRGLKTSGLEYRCGIIKYARRESSVRSFSPNECPYLLVRFFNVLPSFTIKNGKKSIASPMVLIMVETPAVKNGTFGSFSELFGKCWNPTFCTRACNLSRSFIFGPFYYFHPTPMCFHTIICQGPIQDYQKKGWRDNAKIK